jgi:hypothetical protein|tara:strand:- start:315 stop:500 length:186 start_codon:yes stop_codon:yes gene_type:complete
MTQGEKQNLEFKDLMIKTLQSEIDKKDLIITGKDLIIKRYKELTKNKFNKDGNENRESKTS